MKAYLITMFIMWIISAVLKVFPPVQEDFPDGVVAFGKFLGFITVVGMAIWTGLLLF